LFIISLVVLGLVMIGAYFLFRDTLNRIQYVERLGVYWITRDNGADYSKRFIRGWMRQMHEPFWYGHGYQVRFRRWTFSFGKLDGQAASFEDQLGGGWMDLLPSELREWA
jgi:hypothetical protein